MSVKLTLVLSGRTLKRFEFDEFERLRIGRSEDCEVLIENLGISRYHAEIQSKDGFHVLRDLQSNNGTFVNGNKVEVHNLNHGDVVTIGKYSLEYTTSRDEPRRGQSETDLPVAVDGALTVQVDPTSLARMASGTKATRVRGYFSLKEGPKRTLSLDKPLFLCGADPEADLRLTGWFCPRVVAVVIRDDTGFRVVDVTEKGNAVAVNGKPRRDVRLSDNDEVRVRDRHMTFNRGAPGAADQ